MAPLQSVIIALACFSAVPMPFVAWDERNMRYMMAAFPLVGVIVGALDLLWEAVAAALCAGPFLRGMGFALLPLAVTGGIHMDGFADVVDARSSHAEPEHRRRIMRDPHVGAFAVVGICAYLGTYAALASELAPGLVGALAGVHVVSRCLCGLAALCWPLSGTQGMLASVTAPAKKPAARAILALELAGTLGVIALVNMPAACAALVGGMAAFFRTRRMARREFGGMSGDLAGYLVQVSGLVMLAALVLVGKVM